MEVDTVEEWAPRLARARPLITAAKAEAKPEKDYSLKDWEPQDFSDTLRPWERQAIGSWVTLRRRLTTWRPLLRLKRGRVSKATVADRGPFVRRSCCWVGAELSAGDGLVPLDRLLEWNHVTAPTRRDVNASTSRGGGSR